MGAVFVKETSCVLYTNTRGLEVVFPGKEKSSAVANFKDGNQAGIKSCAVLNCLCALG